MRKLFFILLIFSSLCLGIQTKVFIWDRSGPHHYFPHPDTTGVWTSPVEQHLQTFVELNHFIMEGEIPAHETLDVAEPLLDLPSDIDSFNIIIGIFGWPGSGSIGYTHEEANRLRNFLESTERMPGHQRALIFEGNDLAQRYADTSGGGSPDTEFFMKYFNVVFLYTSLAPPLLIGEIGTCFEGFSANYHFNPEPGGPDTTCDDVIIYTMTPWTSHASSALRGGLFKDPARAIVRRTYSPGATILFSFTTGNIEGENARRELMKRATDFSICPVGEIIFPFPGYVLDTTDVIMVRYWHYDNYLVHTLKVKFTADGGLSWDMLRNSTYPSDADTMFQWFVPNLISNDCYMVIELTDDAKNFYADTMGPFSISASANVREFAQRIFFDAPYPNPFNSSVLIPVDAGAGVVDIRDIAGRTIKTIEKKAYSRAITWDGKDEFGEEVPAGLYLINVRTPMGRKVHKVIFAP